ncbi:MAG: Ig-like domain-containing protein [Muribaculum sp.]|nr:Ig-like domain-containing protein [Muribaculum sp.]
MRNIFTHRDTHGEKEEPYWDTPQEDSVNWDEEYSESAADYESDAEYEYGGEPYEDGVYEETAEYGEGGVYDGLDAEEPAYEEAAAVYYETEIADGQGLEYGPDGAYEYEGEPYEGGAYEEAAEYEDGGLYEEAAAYEESGVYEEAAAYEEFGVYEEAAAYEESGAYEEAAAYEEDGVYEETAAYEESGVYEEAAAYEEPGAYDGEAAYGESDAYYEEEIEYYEDGAYGGEPYEDGAYEDGMYEDEPYGDEPYERPVAGVFAWLAGMTSMDKVMLGAGVCVLLLAVVTGIVFLRTRGFAGKVSAFASVGTQLDGIEIVGDRGLLAVADAALAKQEAAKLLEPGQENGNTYQEIDYQKDVTVALKTVSVQKDLKIKFVNQSTDKLIPNVPFSVTITTPEGKSETWSDDDMDGIIYKKGITPGNYQVAVDALNGDKYTRYSIPSGTKTAEVKKDIAYQKIDVSDEVKTESQIDVSKEEQKKQEPAVESSLEDTVEWVESTAVTSTYIEVSRSNITDPMTLVQSGTFLRMAKEIKLNQTEAKMRVGGGTLKLKVSHSFDDIVSVGWYSSDDSVADVDVEGVVTAYAPGTATIYCTVTAVVEEDGETQEMEYEAYCNVTVTGEEAFGGIVSVDAVSVMIQEKEKETVQITPDGFDSGKKLSYSVTCDDTNVATAKVDKNGKITITGVSAGQTTVTAYVNYSSGPLSNPPSADIEVIVSETAGISLSKKAVTVYVDSPVTLEVSLQGDVNGDVTVKSSDEKVAEAELDGDTLTITGLKAGTATITVSVNAYGEKLSAACAVTVKRGAEDDKTTPLKDNQGNQLYVQEGGDYREAVYADYYKEDVRFFKRGETKYTGWQTIDGKVYFFDASGKKVTGEQVIQGAKYTFGDDGALVTGSGVMGIDVSRHNGAIDWKAVKNSGVTYVIIRCGYRGYTQGSLIIDSTFEQNIKGATAAGLNVGVYFFSQAVDEVEAVQEASFVLDAVKGYRLSYPVFLDVEYSGAAGNKGRADGLGRAERTAVCRAFCETIRSGGYTAGVYANKTWLETMIDPGQLGAYKIWLAQYAAAPTYQGRYDMWQYKSTGKVSGISGNVDMNLSYMH